MDYRTKFLLFVVKIAFFIIFIIHTFFIALKIRYPEVPEVKVSKRHLGDIEFPLCFKVCFHDIANRSSRFQMYGYQHAYDFYRGKSMFNGSLYGWEGHNKFQKTLGPVRGKLQMYAN